MRSLVSGALGFRYRARKRGVESSCTKESVLIGGNLLQRFRSVCYSDVGRIQYS